MSVTLKIESCEKCPHRGAERFYTGDSWEYVESWFCNKAMRPKPAANDMLPVVKDSSLIAHVERAADKPKEIPVWCPLR